MNINRINSQKGIAQFLVIAVMAFLALGIPATTKLVQQSQENRSKAAGKTYNSISGSISNVIQNTICGAVKTEALSATTDKDNPSLLCKSGLVWQYHMTKPTCNGFSCDQLPPNLKEGYYSWYCVTGVDPGLDLTDANVKQQISDLKGKVVNCKSTTTTIVQENPKCGSANGQVGNEYPPKEKLCAIGVPSEVALNKTTMVYTWQCQLNDKKVSCSSNTKPNIIEDTIIVTSFPTKIPNEIKTTPILNDKEITGEDVNKPQVINGVCGSVKYSELTETSDKDKPELLCKSGKVEHFGKMTPRCIQDTPNCPPSVYYWNCLGINNGGKSVKCSVKQTPSITPTPSPITGIKVSPETLKLKVGQSQNLTYILTPSSSADTVKWSTSAEGIVSIEKITTKCSNSPNTKCMESPGINHLQITALKPGTVKIKLITSSGKSAEATVVISDVEYVEVINGACGSIKYSELTETSDKDKPELLCKSGKVVDFSKLTYRCLNTEPNCPQPYYTWKCLGSNGGKNVKCSVRQNITPTSRPTLVPTRFPPTRVPTRPPQLPATSIRISPLGLSLKVGQNRNLTYVLSPGSSTDTVKWSTTGSGQIRIQKITAKCADSPNAKCIDVPGINNLLVTGLKAGTVKITLTTSSGKTASSTIIINK